MFRVLQFLALMATGLAAGVAFAHLLQAEPKSLLTPEQFLAVHQVLMSQYPPVMLTVEGGAFVACVLSLWVGGRGAGVWTLHLVAAIALGAMVAVWAIWVEPINTAVATWGPGAMPSDWANYRDRWHYLQGVRLALAMMAQGILIVTAMTAGPKRSGFMGSRSL